MLFQKAFLTTCVFAVLAITNVASVPTAQSSPSDLVVRTHGTPLTDMMNACYNQIQPQCTDIGKKIDGCGKAGVDVAVAAEIVASLTIVVNVLLKLAADLQACIKVGVSINDVQSCGNIFLAIVNILVSILLKLFASCQPAALTICAAIVLQLKVNIQLIANIIIGACGGLLLTLVASIKLCLDLFLGVCIKF